MRYITPSDIPLLDSESLLEILRDATEDDVARVMPRFVEDGATITGSHACLLEFFNRMIDELIGEYAEDDELDHAHAAELAAKLAEG